METSRDWVRYRLVFVLLFLLGLGVLALLGDPLQVLVVFPLVLQIVQVFALAAIAIVLYYRLPVVKRGGRT